MPDISQKIIWIDKKINIAKLPIAKKLLFNLHLEKQNSKCLANIRVEL